MKLLPKGMGEQEVIQLVNTQYNRSIGQATAKRAKFKKNEEIYLNTKDQDKKILSKYIWSTVQSLRGMHFVDDKTIQFSGFKIGDDNYAFYLDKLSDFDYKAMNLKKKRIRVYEDKFKYGVGIEIFTDWDKARKIPLVRRVHPNARVPDLNPSDDYGPAFHGFEMTTNMEVLKDTNSGYELNGVTLENFGTNNSLNTKSLMVENRGLTGQGDIEGGLNIYHHYFYANGGKFHATLTGDLSKLIRCIELLPDNDAQRQNPMLIPFPVVARNWISIDGDPRGVNIFDILADKQMAMQLFDNLARIKATDEALGDIILVDPLAVPDLTDLQKKGTGPIIKHANLSMGNPFTIVPKGTTPSNVWNTRAVIQDNAFQDVGLDARSMGVSTSGNITATENNRVQANANIRHMIGITEDTFAEEKFWLLWYRYYKLFFSKAENKIFKVTNDLGYTEIFDIPKDEFISDIDISVEVRTKSEIEEERQKKLMSFMAMYGPILQDPELPVSSRKYVQRKMLELQGRGQDEINRVYYPSPEELEALGDLVLLNENEEVGDIQDMHEDHLTYLMIYDQAKDTDAKRLAIDRRKEAMRLSGQAQKMDEAMLAQMMQGAGDQNQGMITNQMMQEEMQQPATANLTNM